MLIVGTDFKPYTYWKVNPRKLESEHSVKTSALPTNSYNAGMSIFPQKRRKPTLPAPRIIPVTAIDELGFDYIIRLSSRKSASIEVRADGVRVCAPHRTTQKELKHWVCAKAAWIREKLEQQQERQNQIPQRSFAEDAQWPFMGDQLSLSIQTGKKNGAQRVGNRLLITLSNRSPKAPPEQIENILRNWYQQQALTVLTEKSVQACQRLETRYRSIRLRRTKSKWGHCTIHGDLQFNWLILQAPESVIDYLVIHECCHLIHHNHSRQYWQLVATLSPNYQQAKQWLNDNGHRLVF